ncbi:PAAR-like domain-containing protein [Sinorhizobium fredii]|uniref:PAAR-like domain-containing protein n=1 Tax=Rhizobium fredii TaxID=380 RepID=UPI0012978DF0|nr:PAAR-like domain-containing protein [Sinorhizobium fredii]MQW95954.1 DUF4150 domain-containing protein [Sinorhizobium fredii]UTY46969.1 DUF4150 domain-containing protein [Sinorhizobium fredii]
MTVFANGLEVSCKAQANKVIAAFPYVAFTPPQTPATPPGVPVPYPTFGMDSDTDKGTSTVKIGGETVNQKNKSYYSKCTGDEAGCAPKKNIITSKITGKEYAHAWSNDVKMDGEPVNRFSDIASNDHTSPQGGGPPMIRAGRPGKKPNAGIECMVGCYDDIADKCNKAGGEAHHIVPDKAYRTGTRDQADDPKKRVAGAPTLGEGVCICLSPKNHDKIHEAEREGMDGIGKAGAVDAKGKPLKGEALRKKKEQLKKSGEWGTGTSEEIHDVAKSTLDELDLSPECIRKAKRAVTKQSKMLDGDQTLRTSNALPSRAAKGRMMNR